MGVILLLAHCELWVAGGLRQRSRSVTLLRNRWWGEHIVVWVAVHWLVGPE